MNLQQETGEVKIEDQCVENKQSTPASCSSISEGSAGSSYKSPTIASPPSASSTQRSLGLVLLLLSLYIDRVEIDFVKYLSLYMKYLLCSTRLLTLPIFSNWCM